jgi:hypothetical protein
VTTTCQFIIDRARSANPLNGPLTADSTDMMTQIRSIQQRAFTAVAGLTRDRFKATASVSSTNGSSARTAQLSSITPPIERVLQVKLAGSGEEVHQVDELDVEAELAPRYFVRGTQLVEVGNDWSAAAGAVALTLLYVYGPTAITVTASPPAVDVSVPDEWIDILVKPLAMYLHMRDPGRDPVEYERLEREYAAAWQGFLEYLTNYGGNEARRFALPTPPEIQKR